MIAVYNDSGIPEKEAKRRYFFQEGIMMENAAAALEKVVTEVCIPTVTHPSNGTCPTAGEPKVLILCGSGNNGGDGLALARRLSGRISCTVYLTASPKTDEAKQQLKMAQAVGVTFTTTPEQELSQCTVIVDCIFGTGFHGELPTEIATLFSKINETSAYKIACDIPSGLGFIADCTITMGALKTALFTDKAKNCTGKIIVADLGISPKLFETCAQPDLYLIEQSDIKLPLRTNKSAHKGTYGHTAVIAGEKSGAAIIAATAALNFGSGLVTLVKAENSNLEQFKISPSLMISNAIPANTTCVQIGSGLGRELSEISPATTPAIITQFLLWFKSAKNPACVLDADIFYYKDFPNLLSELNSVSDAKIIMTPHPKELLEIVKALTAANMIQGLECISTVAQATEQRQKIGEEITSRFANVTIVMKSANTVICSGDGGASKAVQTQHNDLVTQAESQTATGVSVTQPEPQTTTGVSGTQPELQTPACVSLPSPLPHTCLIADGTPALAKAGSGDVLAGMNSALLAQGYSAKDAAITATEAHALASCLEKNKGQAFDLTPEKLIEALGKLSSGN